MSLPRKRPRKPSPTSNPMVRASRVIVQVLSRLVGVPGRREAVTRSAVRVMKPLYAQADRHTLEMCMAQCDVLMQSSERRRGITALVRSKLFRDSGVFPTLPDVADELGIHPRTLRRRLAEEGTSFRSLLNEARSTVAIAFFCHAGGT